jgi:hypothetical protein
MIKTFIASAIVFGLLASSALAGQPVTIQNSANTAAVGVTGTSLNVNVTGSSGTPSVVQGNVSNATSGVATSATNVPNVSYNYYWNGTTWDQGKTAPAITTNGLGLSASGIASIYMSTLPTNTNGQYGMLQMTARGSIRSFLTGPTVNGTNFGNLSRALVNVEGSDSNGFPLGSSPYLSNGTSQDQAVSIVGAVAAGTGTTAVAIAPTSASPAAITPSISASSAATSLVAKASAGNYYDAYCQSTAAGRCIIYNATAAPGAGALTAALVLECAVVAAGGQGSIQYGDIPRRASTGITVLFSSSTDCNTYTASSTAYIHASVQ